ncbi:MAG: hypothetical protein GDA51_01805 [Ekhidna sp.]|nr:hypothetical protein [Ekhidna sp.]
MKIYAVKLRVSAPGVRARYFKGVVLGAAKYSEAMRLAELKFPTIAKLPGNKAVKILAVDCVEIKTDFVVRHEED